MLGFSPSCDQLLDFRDVALGGGLVQAGVDRDLLPRRRVLRRRRERQREPDEAGDGGERASHCAFNPAACMIAAMRVAFGWR